VLDGVLEPVAGRERPPPTGTDRITHARPRPPPVRGTADRSSAPSSPPCSTPASTCARPNRRPPRRPQNHHALRPRPPNLDRHPTTSSPPTWPPPPDQHAEKSV
jgi:hypothetical protein